MSDPPGGLGGFPFGMDTHALAGLGPHGIRINDVWPGPVSTANLTGSNYVIDGGLIKTT